MFNSPPDSAPSRRQWLRLSLGAGLGGVFAVGPEAKAALPPLPAVQWRERHLQALGTHLHLRAAHTSAAAADAGLDAAVAAIWQVQRHMSLFDPASAVSQLNRTGVLHDPHPDLVQILRLAQGVSAQSQGAFDVTVQPYWVAWQTAQQAGRLATAQELLRAQARVGWQNLQVSANKISFKRPGMGITLNGIAQGFAGDVARAALQSHGIEQALLDTGEWTAWGDSPQGGPWRLGVANPRAHPVTNPILATVLAGGVGRAARRMAQSKAQNSAQGRAEPAATHRVIASSSDAHYRFGEGDANHHIFNPKTGYSPRELASVTVAGDNGAWVDALTKVMLMGSMSQAMEQAERFNVEVLAVGKNGRWQASKGFALG